MVCIYCKRESSATGRRAHIAPQALLPSDTLLPPGAECDDCNEYAGQLERVLILHNRIWPILMLAGIPGKRGRPRKRLGHFVRREGNVEADLREGRVTFTSDKIDVQLPDPAEFDDLVFRRALHHMAFNYLALKKGAEYALDPRYDGVRSYVRQAKPAEKWPYAQLMYPEHQVNKKLRLTLIEDAPGCVVRFISFLDEFYVDLQGTGRLHTWAREHLPEDVGLL